MTVLSWTFSAAVLGTSCAAKGDAAGDSLPGVDDSGEDPVPFDGPQVSLGQSHGCVLHEPGPPVCWGNEHSDIFFDGVPQPPGDFVQMSTNGYHACAVDASGQVACWGADAMKAGVVEPPKVAMRQVAAGAAFTCGITLTGELTCWGYGSQGQTSPPKGSDYVRVAAGSSHACALDSKGAVVCWGRDTSGQAAAGDGVFQDVSCGVEHTCGLNSDGEIECWGTNQDAEGNYQGQSTPPDGVFRLVVASMHTSCALNESGLPVCWGMNSDTVFSPPASTFETMGIGYLAACALAEGDLDCWGDKGIVDAAP